MTRRDRTALGTLLLAHLALSLLFNAFTPIFEGPDEPNHYLFIRYLQLERRLPVQGLERDAVRAHHPPGYFVLGALLTALAPAPPEVTTRFASLSLQTNPRYDFRFDDPAPENKSVFLHFGPGEAWPYSGLARTVHLGRLLSLAFTLLAVGLTYGLGRQLRPGDTVFALLAAGLIAFNPMVLFMSGVIQNDASALAAGAGVLAALGWAVRRPSAGRWLVVGVVYGLGILLKAGSLALAAPIALGVVSVAWTHHTAWQARARALVIAGLSVALPLALLDGWWFIRNHRLYGDWTANASITALWGALSPEAQRQFVPLALYTLTTGMLGRFGNGGIIDFPKWVYALAGVLGLIGLWSAARLALRWARSAPADSRRPAVVVWAAHALTVVSVAVSVWVFALRFNGGATGKYLFPLFPSLALVLAAGWQGAFAARGRVWVSAALLGLSLAASLYAAFGLLRPAYGPPRRPLPGELQFATPLEADLGGTARVLAYRLDTPNARPGETIRVTVYWLPESQTDVPYTVFVHLMDAGGSLLAQRDIYPGNGTYRTTVWVPGRAFADTYSLRVPSDAPATTGAQLALGLYDEASGTRLTAGGADAGPPGTDYIQIGTVTIAR